MEQIWDPCPYPVLFLHGPQNLLTHSCISHVSSPCTLTRFTVAVPDPGTVLALRPTLILAIQLLGNCLTSLGTSLAGNRSHLICYRMKMTKWMPSFHQKG